MTDQNFPVIQTPIAYTDFCQTFKDVYSTEFGYEVDAIIPKICFSQQIVECGWVDSKKKIGGKSCFNYNVGNIKYTVNGNNGKAKGYHMLKNVWEIINGKKVIFQPNHPQTFFRCYDSLSEGITDYMLFLSRRDAVWSALHSAQDTKSFVDALVFVHYFTADPKEYYRILNSVFNML